MNCPERRSRPSVNTIRMGNLRKLWNTPIVHLHFSMVSRKVLLLFCCFQHVSSSVSLGLIKTLLDVSRMTMGFSGRTALVLGTPEEDQLLTQILASNLVLHSDEVLVINDE